MGLVVNMAAAEAAQGEKAGEAAVPTPAPAPIVPTEAIVHPIGKACGAAGACRVFWHEF